MSGRWGARIPESQLTDGLARVYHYGSVGVFLLLLFGLIHPLTGWEPARTVMTVGVIALLALPIVTVLWVGLQALMKRDRHLVLIVLGIVVLLAAARLVPMIIS